MCMHCDRTQAGAAQTCCSTTAKVQSEELRCRTKQRDKEMALKSYDCDSGTKKVYLQFQTDATLNGSEHALYTTVTCHKLFDTGGTL